MKTLRERLLDADALAGPPALTPAEAAAMRRRIVAEAGHARLARPVWRDALAVAAVVALMMTVGVVGGRRMSPDGTPVLPTAGRAVESQPERRQLQFSTPGGTRIIWVFDSEFTVKETVP